ncbi:hypothetical protein BO71DRAFT_442325 [Aspergillus ellipticus CBS 707.79]|uniref:Aminoglycoside phosphotransferase domain-containing protein n=1 Tax=Aspergillus ellipticus CBS 707.79 TaxID=1448320 RepID=A0A319DEB0_9EURO|nr:hypothetical protein BO71DRAFT_442325 [Aspergillus ellipticus CBS 707.79]
MSGPSPPTASESEHPRADLLERICHILDTATDSSSIQFTPSLAQTRPPIVPKEDILNARDYSPNRINGCYILELSASTLLKVGPAHRVQMGEAEAMILVRNQTSVPVPRVLNAYSIAEIGFILMEKLPGVQLDDCWDGLPRALKESLSCQLRDYVARWRQIQGPFYGTVDGGPCLDVVFQHSWENVRSRYGPFASRSAFNEGMVQALRNSRPGGRLTKRDERFADRLLASGSGEEGGGEEMMVLTHGDLHPSNILVQDGVITGIVDWGAAGYSVSEREYFCLRWSALDPEWIELSTSILPSDGYDFWKEVNYQMMAYTCI